MRFSKALSSLIAISQRPGFQAIKSSTEIFGILVAVIASIFALTQYSESRRLENEARAISAIDSLTPQLQTKRHKFGVSENVILELEVPFQNLSSQPVVFKVLPASIFDCFGAPAIPVMTPQGKIGVVTTDEYTFLNPVDPRTGVTYGAKSIDVFKAQITSVENLSIHDFQKSGFTGTFVVLVKILAFSQHVFGFEDLISEVSRHLSSSNALSGYVINPRPPLSTTYSYAQTVFFEKGEVRLGDNSVCQIGINKIFGIAD